MRLSMSKQLRYAVFNGLLIGYAKFFIILITHQSPVFYRTIKKKKRRKTCHVLTCLIIVEIRGTRPQDRRGGRAAIHAVGVAAACSPSLALRRGRRRTTSAAPPPHHHHHHRRRRRRCPRTFFSPRQLLQKSASIHCDSPIDYIGH